MRGLWRGPVHIRYEMGIYTAGNPPWETSDKAGGWLANHSPPHSAVLYVPDVPDKGPTMLIGSYVSEGCAGLGKQWKVPRAERGMLLDALTPSDENFWPSVTQAADGQVYLCTGRPNALARVEGLESVRSLPATERSR